METKAIGKTTVSARVIRADGTVEDLGMIASSEGSMFDHIHKLLNKGE